MEVYSWDNHLMAVDCDFMGCKTPIPCGIITLGTVTGWYLGLVHPSMNGTMQRMRTCQGYEPVARSVGYRYEFTRSTGAVAAKPPVG